MNGGPTRALAVLSCALAFTTACTLEAGHGFATLEDGALSMELAAGRSRDLGDGAFLTDRGYRIHPTELTLQVADLSLLELHAAQGGAGASFDPANPPEGFSLCHGGHCHAADGSLVDYADVQAMLAGGAATFEPLAIAPVEHTFDLLDGDEAALTQFMPSAELPQGSVDRIEIGVVRLQLSAEVEGGELSEPVSLEIDLPIEEPIAGTLSVRIDRDGPEQLEPAVTLRFGATLLDGLELSSFVDNGDIVVDGEGPAADAVREWLASADLRVDF